VVLAVLRPGLRGVERMRVSCSVGRVADRVNLSGRAASSSARIRRQAEIERRNQRFPFGTSAATAGLIRGR
jgi:hypothetical protein